MRTYKVEGYYGLSRGPVVYDTVQIEAENKRQAELMACEQLSDDRHFFVTSAIHIPKRERRGQ